MKTLFMMLGLPGCGKSTEARNMLGQFGHGNAKIVNKDALRAMLDDGRWSGPNEKFLLGIRDHIIVAALEAGKHVIVDDTGFSPKHSERLRQLARENGAGFQVIDMTDVPIDVCIERDLKRLNSVGEAVIRKMYRDFLAPKPPVIEFDPALPNAVICDIDGTLAIMNGRGPFQWDKVGSDLPNPPVVALLEFLDSVGPNPPQVIFVSGRDEACRESTQQWIKAQVGDIGPLFMRPAGDTRDDRLIKREIYEREIQGKYNVLWVMDDRAKVVAQWREMGLPCFQVAEGDF